MRTNTRNVLEALRNRKPCTKAESIWTDGKVTPEQIFFEA